MCYAYFMLSLFPTLLTYQLLAPTLLRLALGFVFVNFGFTKIGRQKTQKRLFFETIGFRPGIAYVWAIALIEIVAGLFLIAGFLTQIAALVSAIIVAIAILLKKKHPSS